MIIAYILRILTSNCCWYLKRLFQNVGQTTSPYDGAEDLENVSLMRECSSVYWTSRWRKFSDNEIGFDMQKQSIEIQVETRRQTYLTAECSNHYLFLSLVQNFKSYFREIMIVSFSHFCRQIQFATIGLFSSPQPFVHFESPVWVIIIMSLCAHVIARASLRFQSNGIKGKKKHRN